VKIGVGDLVVRWGEFGVVLEELENFNGLGTFTVNHLYLILWHDGTLGWVERRYLTSIKEHEEEEIL